MNDPSIAEIDKIWLQSLAMQSKNNRKKLVDCPFSFIKVEDGVSKVDKAQCGYGKGSWCKICNRHTFYQKQFGKSKKIVESAKARRLNRLGKEKLTITKTGTKEQIKEAKLEDRR